MSIPVALDEIEETARPLGPAAFVVANAEAGPPLVLHAVIRFDHGELCTTLGRRMRRAVAAAPDVAVVWPPSTPGAMSLIVDTVAVAPADADGGVRLRPTGAVWHRPAPVEGTGPDGGQPAAG